MCYSGEAKDKNAVWGTVDPLLVSGKFMYKFVIVRGSATENIALNVIGESIIEQELKKIIAKMITHYYILGTQYG